MPFDNTRTPAALKLLNTFAAYSEAKGADLAIEVIRGHMFFFDNSITHKIRLQHVENDELIGWSFLTTWHATCFANALICNTEPNLMKFLNHETLTNVATYNPYIRFFTFQGSENSGQHFMKSRLNATRILEKTHLLFS